MPVASNDAASHPVIAISGVVIVRDAESTIASCLRSMERFAEVVVYDNGSADRTPEIARSFANVSLHTGMFSGFGPTKNRAAALARHPWILSIDSDESLSPELVRSIASIDRDDASAVYSVWRQNFMMGRLVRHSGWGKDWLPRLYHRDKARLSDAAVHENLTWDPDCNVRRLEGPLYHAAVQDLGDMLVKVNRYAEIRRRTRPRVMPPAAILFRSWWAFWRTWIFRGGWLDGWRGLAIAWSNANGVFYKYMKSYADAARAREGDGHEP